MLLDFPFSCLTKSFYFLYPVSLLMAVYFRRFTAVNAKPISFSTFDFPRTENRVNRKNWPSRIQKLVLYRFFVVDRKHLFFPLKALFSTRFIDHDFPVMSFLAFVQRERIGQSVQSSLS